ncbi:sensor histidine kinase [Anaerocolumna sedimenticola]|uniref:sensor histidine kinase n=1 Tax=Anaerocolumna sedimenticola TaxID=2696063 RepID=UPI001FE2F8AA|nr:HAMP domain-containing sensor histidine kinase [Anaerocolumna sedimenticola]
MRKIETFENNKKAENEIYISANHNSDLRIFNSSISHEIKAPIRAIDGYARIFLEDYGTDTDKNGVELIENIRSICNDTLLLINKLLDYTKYAEMDPIKEPVDLKNIIQSVFQKLVGSYSPSNTALLQFESNLPIILSDRFLMEQVITNILSNSLKFTRGKEEAVITVGFRYEDSLPIFL